MNELKQKPKWIPCSERLPTSKDADSDECVWANKLNAKIIRR